MRTSNAPMPTCSCPSVPRPGRTFWFGQCLPSNCFAQPRSLRTIPIIAKDRAMRGWILALIACPLLAASALAQPVATPLDATLKAAEVEQASAEAQTRRLEQIASQARGEADRLHAEQAAAAQAIDAAEARISAANARLQLASAQLTAHRRQLAAEQQPASSLLAGLA